MPQKKIYTKEEVDSKLGAKVDSSRVRTSMTGADANSILTVSGLIQVIDASTYKKTEIDTKLNNKVDTSDFQIATDEEIKSLLGIS